jgi:hypothetical protein
MDKVNLAEKLSLIHEHWRPKVVGALNGQEVKLVKFRGEFFTAPTGERIEGTSECAD